MRLLARRMRETGREYALRNLKDNIIHLELKPGSMVSENELAAQMGLSRTPVREALMELSKVRLVDVYPQRGSAVALIDYDLVEDLLGYVVQLPKSAKYAQILKNSVAFKETANERIFLMKDLAAVEEAVGLGAKIREEETIF